MTATTTLTDTTSKDDLSAAFQEMMPNIQRVSGLPEDDPERVAVMAEARRVMDLMVLQNPEPEPFPVPPVPPCTTWCTNPQHPSDEWETPYVFRGGMTGEKMCSQIFTDHTDDAGRERVQIGRWRMAFFDTSQSGDADIRGVEWEVNGARTTRAHLRAMLPTLTAALAEEGI